MMKRSVTASWAIAGAFMAAGLVVTASPAPAVGQTSAGQGRIGTAPAAEQAQQQAPGRAGGGRAGGARAGGGGRGGGRGRAPSEVRSIPAEETAAKYANPNWKAPRQPWGDPDLEGEYSSDDMRGVPASRPAAQADREHLTPEEFLQRASGDEANKFSSVNTETFLRNEYGIRTFGYTSLIVDPPNGQQPPMTQAAMARRKAEPQRGTFSDVVLADFDDFTLYDRCISRGVPGSINPVLYGNGVRFVQSPTEIVMTYEMIHESRIIHLDNRERLSPAHKLWAGESIGHFEGDTLVVETTNFRGDEKAGWLDVNGSPYTEALKMTERFRRPTFGTLEIDITIDDPKAYTKPFTVKAYQRLMVDQEMIEFICNENERSTEHIKRN
jgi:hypothetical protein